MAEGWPMRRHVRVLSTVLGTVVVLYAALMFVTRPRHDRIDDPRRYGELLRHFPATITAHLPASIPSNAQAVQLLYTYDGGLGPGNWHMVVKFRVPAAEASALLGHAQSVAGTGYEVEVKPGSVSVVRGDRVGRVIVDRATGDVEIDLSVN